MYNVDEESVFGGYSTFMNAGASIAWNVISLGVEYRAGTANYKDLTGSEEDYEGDVSTNRNPQKIYSRIKKHCVLRWSWRIHRKRGA